jgi:intracellular sulfur oxidation DsrE/DsrF family protein
MVLFTLVPFAASNSQDPEDEKPFAEARVVLQLSDQTREDVVLDVANNLIRHYGSSDLVDIEIVTFGPGIRLLYEGSDHAARISSLVDSGVRFYICGNTLDMVERETGSRPDVSPDATPVPAGVAHIIERVEQGFTLIRP